MSARVDLQPTELVMSHARLLWRETKRSVALWSIPVLGLLGWWYVSARMQTGTITWPHTSLAIGLAGSIMLPAVAGVAAWVGGRERRRGLSDLLESTPRPTLTRDLAAWGGVVLWSLVAYVALAVILVIDTDVLGTWNGPVYWPMLVGALMVALGAAIGYACGSLIASRFVPALLPILLAYVIGVPHTIGLGWPSLKRLSPEAQFWPYDYHVFSGLDSGRALPFVLWIGGLTALTFAVFCLIRRRSVTPAVAVALTLAVSVAGAAMLLDDGSRANAERSAAQFEPVCETGVVTVCTHPAYERYLDDVSAALQPVFAQVQGLEGVPGRVEQHDPMADAEIPEDGIRLYMDWFDDPGIVVADVVSQLVQHSYDPTVTASDAAGVVQLAIGRWLLRGAGVDEGDLSAYRFASTPERAAGIDAEADVVLDRFAALPEAEQRAWLEEHFAALRAGEITAEDVP
jgi:hypothetical protein